MRKGGVWLLSVPVALAVAACTSSSGDDPTFSPTSTYTPPSHSVSPDPSTTAPVTTGANVRPGEKPPTLPPAARANTDAGAIAFAQYWERTIDWGYATADSTLARSAYAPSCAGCERFMKQFDGARSKGVHFRGGRMQLIGSALQPNDHHLGSTAVVDVTLSAQALEAIDRTGKVVESDPAVSRMTDRVWARWANGRWTVVDWKHVQYK